jgi:hypothetical protein
MAVGVPPRTQRDTLPSAKVGYKICLQVAIAHFCNNILDASFI